MTNEDPHRIVADAAGAVDETNHSQPTAPSASFQSGLEAAMERDRCFFARHPFLSEYTREIMPGEYPRSMIPKEIPASCEVCGVVTVRQIAPGLRTRAFADVFFAITAADLQAAASDGSAPNDA
jgi:hypothetical protein